MLREGVGGATHIAGLQAGRTYLVCNMGKETVGLLSQYPLCYQDQFAL